jgi:flagellar basal-body rod protein FlgC
MSTFSALRISASGLTAERLRMDLIANNIANQRTTHGANGEAYRRRVAVFTPNEMGKAPGLASETGSAPATMGVRVAQILEDPRPGNPVYDPKHPDANAEGYVTYPNVDLVTEMVDMMSATRAYEANVVAGQAAKAMAARAIDLGR